MYIYHGFGYSTLAEAEAARERAEAAGYETHSPAGVRHTIHFIPETIRCKTCGGSGDITITDDEGTWIETCPRCEGEGHVR